MNVIQYSDYSDPIRYGLTFRPQPGAEVEIVLDLYRGSASVSQTAIARVGRPDADKVLQRCRRDLERRGLRPVAPAPRPKLEVPLAAPDPRHILPLAAFDWMFEAS